MKQFLIKITTFFIFVSIPFVSVLAILPRDYHFDGADVILKYQKLKLKNSTEFNIGYFGDSSCGYAIDSKLLKPKSLNLSLVGDFNLIGTFEMIKNAKRKNTKLKRVIIMHDVSVYGYETDLHHKFFNDYSFITKIKRRLSIFHTKLKKGDFINLFTQNNIIENDFLKPSDYISGIDKNFSMENELSNMNKTIILKIVAFCESKKMDYIFLIGPNVKINKNKYFISFEKFFKENNLNFSSEYYLIDEENVGDQKNHVRTEYKIESTFFYERIIDNYFKNDNLFNI